MQPDIIPEWVPQSVQYLARGLRISDPRLTRFLTHSDMIKVWRYLEKQPVETEAFKLLDDISKGTLDNFGLGVNRSNTERALAAIYFSVFQIVIRGDDVTTRASAEKKAKKYTDLSSGCKSMRLDVVPHDQDIVDALLKIEEFCEKWRAFFLADRSPYFLERSSGGRNNDTFRGHVRSIAQITRILYGNYLYGQLATMANVLFGPESDKEITEENVTDWCRNMPSE